MINFNQNQVDNVECSLNYNYNQGNFVRPVTSNISDLNNSMSSLKIHSSRRKRKFNEIDIDLYGGLEKEKETVSITKKLKLNSNNGFISKTYEVPREIYFNSNRSDSKTTPEYNDNPNNVNMNIESNCGSEKNNVVIDMENEKKMVESYYADKNKCLFIAMFGEY